MTYQDVVKADVLRPYCEAMGVASVDDLPRGKAKAPNDIQIRCGMMVLKDIKGPSCSQWSSPTLNPHIPTTIDICNPSISMSIHVSDEELSDFELYDANCAPHLVAKDEGKAFTKVLQKPAGRKILKRTLYRSLGAGPSNHSNHPRNNPRRPMAHKGPPSVFVRPPTPYPQINNIPLVTGPDGRLQLAQMGGRLPAYSTPDAGSSNSYTAPTATYHRDPLATENARLRRELEELRTCEVDTIRPGQMNYLNTVVPNEVGLNIMGLTVSDPPLVRPVAERAFVTVGDTNMATN
ncbi:hypothetical protein M407DRAFT_30246 [Tulasnella calospora MUT 4182]|uniref:Uncharacterized protein n=1 Tax=Tulasnella calospora MUT 4182 TaxID=1051891 RepID=A0A0C3Q8J9_9AGAM|nr:hypothetical protein M407DRAFT_30246 [Tulasnella calospora MUT 4182]